MKRFIYTVLIFLTTQIGYAQNLVEYPTGQLKEDFLELREHLETKNPIIYLYQSKEAVTAFLDNIEKSITNPMTELEYFRLISPISSFIKDGHNLIMPSSETRSYIQQSPHILPFQIAFVNGVSYVRENYSEEQGLLAKSKIYAIDNHSIDSIINRFYLVLPTEGLQTQLPEKYINQWFRFLYHLHFGFEEKYRIQYTYLNDEVKETVVKGLSLNEMEEMKKNGSKKKGIAVINIDSIPNTAILNVPSFASSTLKEVYNQKKFKQEIDNCFEMIIQKNIKHLIIDIRENDGGSPDYAVYLLKYLMDEKFTHALDGRVVKFPKEEDVLKRTRKRWLPFYGIGEFKPKKKNYDGKIYVLIGGGTFSAGVEFCSVLRKYEKATFIGQETGGNPVVMGGNYIKGTRTLKNTGITHYSGIICTLYEDLKLNNGRGIIPNYFVQIKIEDIILDRDRCLEKAISVISEYD